jgi:hypothetical protein
VDVVLQGITAVGSNTVAAMTPHGAISTNVWVYGLDGRLMVVLRNTDYRTAQYSLPAIMHSSQPVVLKWMENGRMMKKQILNR